MKIGLEPPTQTVPESKSANANLSRTNNTQLLAGTNRNDFSGWEKATCIVQKQ